MTNALIYVTAGNVNRYTDRCAEYCNRLGLRLAAVVVDELDGGRWPEVVQLLMDGRVQVVVVADRDELPRSGRLGSMWWLSSGVGWCRASARRVVRV